MRSAAYCIAPTMSIANDIVNRLKAAGIHHNDISVLFPDKSNTRDFAHEKNTKATEVAAAGAGAGVVVGGTLGLLAGIGMLAIPGVGPLIAAGPIMAALNGIAIGATIGGIAGALIGMGIPEFESRLYERKVNDGNILISVHAEASTQASAAEGVFKDSGATDISSGPESSPDNPPADPIALVNPPDPSKVPAPSAAEPGLVRALARWDNEGGKHPHAPLEET